MSLNARIRLGNGFQAMIPQMIGKQAPDDTPEHSLKLWEPFDDIEDQRLDVYLNFAKNKCNYSEEQALGVLYWNEYDLMKAKQQMNEFTPFHDEWTQHEKQVFEELLETQNRDLDQIHSLMPQKSKYSLVMYHYSRKCAKHQKSLVSDKSYYESNSTNNTSAIGLVTGAHNNSQISGFENKAIDSKEDLIEWQREATNRCSNCFTTSSTRFFPIQQNWVLCGNCFQYCTQASGALNYNTQNSSLNGMNSESNGIDFNKDNSIMSTSGALVNDLNKCLISCELSDQKTHESLTNGVDFKSKETEVNKENSSSNANNSITALTNGLHLEFGLKDVVKQENSEDMSSVDNKSISIDSNPELEAMKQWIQQKIRTNRGKTRSRGRSSAPKGMALNLDELKAIANQSSDELIKDLKKELFDCKRMVRKNKQIISQLKPNLIHPNEYWFELNPNINKSDSVIDESNSVIETIVISSSLL